jgi:flagellar biogenesis protein FliO
MIEGLQILSILALFGVLFYLWYAVKTGKGIGSWLVKNSGKRQIKVLDSIGIAPRTAAILLEVKDQPVVVVLSPHGVAMHGLGNQDPGNFADHLGMEDEVTTAAAGHQAADPKGKSAKTSLTGSKPPG